MAAKEIGTNVTAVRGDVRVTEAGSRRASGHRIGDAPLSEYQKSPLAPACDIRWGDDSRQAQADGFIVILPISLVTMICQVR